MKTRWVLWPTGLLLAVLVLLSWQGEAIMRRTVAVHHGAVLVRDIDHRMKPGQEPGLNSDNIRAVREADASADAFNVVFLGDSYVFGLWLDVTQAPPAQLEAILREHYGTDRINVWNFGWISSSPYLSLRLLRDLGDKYRPDLVLINVDMTDFKDDYFYRRVIEPHGIYRLAEPFPRLFFHIKWLLGDFPFTRHLHQRWFGYPDAGDYFVARQPMADSLVYFETVRDSLQQIERYSRERWQAPFVAFLPPRHWQYTDRESPQSWEAGKYDVLGPHALEPFRYFEAAGPDMGFPLVPLLEDFRATGRFPLNFEGDSHWNAEGARFAAERVFHHCLALGCFRALDARFGAKLPADQALAPAPGFP